MHPITLRALDAFPDLLEAHYAAVPDAFRTWVPPSWDGVPSERLSAIEQVCHVRDIEIEGYHVRFQRTLSETNPVLGSIDSEPLARERSYTAADAREVLKAFREARSRTVALLRGLQPAQFSRTAQFDGYGPVSLRSLVHFLCSHDQQHLAGIQWLLGKIEASAGGRGMPLTEGS